MSSSARPVTELQIGGVAYRVQSSADESELRRLAALVERRLTELPATQRHDSRSLVLVALALAHELELEQQAHDTLRGQVATHLTSLVNRIDTVLDHCDDNGNPLPQVPKFTLAKREAVSPTLADVPATDSSDKAPAPGRPVTRRARPEATTATSDSTRPPRVR